MFMEVKMYFNCLRELLHLFIICIISISIHRTILEKMGNFRQGSLECFICWVRPGKFMKASTKLLGVLPQSDMLETAVGDAWKSEAGKAPHFLFTNNAWSLPYKHFQMETLKAIPWSMALLMLIDPNLTGISCLICFLLSSSVDHVREANFAGHINNVPFHESDGIFGFVALRLKICSTLIIMKQKIIRTRFASYLTRKFDPSHEHLRCRQQNE